MKKVLIALVLVSSLVYAASLDYLPWHKVTIAAASTTALVSPGSAQTVLIQSLIITTEVANHIYMYEGTAASHIKISPDINLPNNGSFVYGVEGNGLGWKGTEGTPLKIWFSANPGNSKTDANIFYKYDLINE